MPEPDPYTVALLDSLRETRRRIDVLEAELALAYEQRTALFQNGQAHTPKVTQEALAEAAGITAVAVSKVLVKAGRKATAEEATTDGP